MGLADERKPVNLMTVHVSKSVTVHEVSNKKVIKSRKSVVKRNRKIDWQITIGMWLFAFLL